MEICMVVTTDLPKVEDVKNGQFFHDGDHGRVMLQLNDMTERHIECHEDSEYYDLLAKYSGKLIEEPTKCGFLFCGVWLNSSKMIHIQ